MASGDPKPFKIGINLKYLYDAVNAAAQCDGRSRWYAGIGIVDELTPIEIKAEHHGSMDDSTQSFYCLTMPCRLEDAFCWDPDDDPPESPGRLN